jgi:branched-chain amino acid transport system permease protein/urea transport system permease protein
MVDLGRRFRFGRAAALNLALLVALGLLPLYGDAYLLNQFTHYLLYGLFALSLSLVWGHAGILCFGQAAFFGLGAYIMAAVTKGLVPGLTGVLTQSWIGLPLAVLGTGLFAYLLGWFLFKGRLSGAYLGIVTLAISVLTERIATNTYYLGAYNGLTNVPVLMAGGYKLDDPVMLYYFIFVVCVLVYVFCLRVVSSPFGAVMAAVKHNENRAEFFGYDIARVKVKAFTLGAMVAGLAGALFAAVAEFVSPTMLGFKQSTEVLIWTAVGGREVLLASFMGALAVRTLESYLSDWLTTYWLVALGLFFVICVVFFPRGVFGRIMAERRGG